MVDIISFLIFLMTISIPTIAIVGELSKTTPSTILHSIIRSMICVGSLFFLSVVLQPSYIPKLSHFISIGFIFSVSIAQLFFELNSTTLNSFIKNKFSENINNN